MSQLTLAVTDSFPGVVRACPPVAVTQGVAPVAPGSRVARRRLSPAAAFFGTAAVFAALFFAAGAPTPLLVQYQHKWGFSPGILTVAFASYTLALLAALLTAGSLSDHLGRRPVIAGALVIELAAMLVFLVAPNVGWVIAGRVVQGLATGIATSAFSAAVIELAPPERKRLGTVIIGSAAAGGLGIGALLTGAAVQFTSDANTIVFAALSAAMAAGIAVAVLSHETAPLRPGAARSLMPNVRVPGAARREFFAGVPVHISAWMLGGLFLGLGPTIIQGVFHIHSGFVEGATAAIYPLAGSSAGVLLGSTTPRRTTAIGGAGILAGAVAIVTGIATHTLPLLLIGGAAGGVGFGGSFAGGVRLISPLVKQHERAGVFAGVYVVAYLAFGVPVLVAGQLVSPLGLVPTVLVYGALAVLAATAGLIAQQRAGRAARAAR
jgi:MFS family permease